MYMLNGKKVVMFNHWFSAIYNTIKSFKESDISDELFIVGSSKNEKAVYKNIVDRFYLEPDDSINDKDYVDWLLDVCRQEKVDILFVKRRMAAVAKSIEMFNRENIKVVCDSYNNIKTLQDKSIVYAKVINTKMVPDYAVTDSYDMLEKLLPRYISKYDKAVVKKACDEGGTSVHIVTLGESNNTFRSYEGIKQMGIENILNSYGLKGNMGDLPKVMIMEYLTDEVSIDCYLRENGDDISIARFKGKGRVQEITRSYYLEEEAIKIGKKLGLKCPYNVQFRKSERGYKVIDVNPRMSGGIYLASMSGINIPLVCLYDILGKKCKPLKFRAVDVSHVETAVLV